MMKKAYNIIAAFAALAVVFSCAKEIDTPAEEPVVPGNGEVAPVQAEEITISASLSDVLTKVGFEPAYSGNKPTSMALTWTTGDIIRVYDHADRSKYDDFTLKSECDGQKAGEFTGTPSNIGSAAAFDVEVYNASAPDYAAQSQPSDGVTTDLKYLASASNIGDYSDISFTEFSSILAITAKMPSTEVAAKIKSVDITASEDIFNGGNAMTITFDSIGDADADGILHFFATLPQGGTDIPAGTTLLVHFKAPGEAHDVYTRFIELPATTFTANKLNTININASASATHAGLTSCDGSNAAKAYLIGDKYQMLAVKDLMFAGSTKYFKLIDDIDLDGESWTKLNPDPFTKVIYLDGNNKIVSHLGASMFEDLNGTVVDLTIENATVSGGSAITGILANTIKTAASTVTNVDVNSSSITASSYAGGLVGQIDAANTSVADCEVSNTDVSGTLAGGVVGFANALVTMSGCTYSGGTVTASARYCGGMVASTGNYNSVISDCHVENATISVSVTNNDFRAGGFIGLQHTNVQVKGCSVGKSAENVTINLSAPASGKVYNVGGFVGVNYGTITQNSSVRNTAFVTITAGNTATGSQMNLGGFVGYNTGTIEYSDAIVTMTGLKGTYIGGFCGIILQSGVIRNCTETGAVSGNNYTGGFVGVIDSATTSISGCSSAGSVTGASSIGGFVGGCTANNKPGTFIGNSTSASVTSSGSNFGGFIGNGVGTFTSNYATGKVASTNGGNGGGFAGGIWEGSSGSVFSKNYSTGNVSGNANLGGLIGYIGGNITISNCYATGNVGNSTMYNQKYGGLVGFTSDNSTYITDGVSITNCYATGDIESSFAGGGLIGRIGLSTTSVSNCAAWNAKVYPYNSGNANWSSGAVVGVAFPTCTLTDNYRNPSMLLTAYWVPATDYQHANVSSTHPLTDSTGAEMADTATAKGQAHFPQYPYHGKVESGKTLSQLASTTLGWSSDIWDFSGPLPLLK